MKTFKKSMAIILSILMLFSLMTVAGLSASAADEETVAIYFVNSGNWDTVNAYAWVSGGDSLKAWPGVAMTPLNEKAANGGDIYVLEYVDAGYDRIIFNIGSDAGKTETQILKQGLYYDYLSDKWYTDPTLEEEVTDPTVDPSQIKYYVAGNAGLCGEDWNPKGEAAVMTDNGDGTYTKVFTGIAAGTYNFKITDGTWDNSWGDEGGKNNIKITVAEDNTDVTITFDLNTKLTTVSMAAGATPSEASSETEPSEASSETEPSEASSETEPSEASSETEPSEASSETEPSEASSETEPSEASSETEPSEASSETEPSEASSETEPSEASSETEPSESTEAPTLPAEGTFHVVAGAPELCNGVNWDPASPLNLMTLGEDEVYSITYTNVPAGTYDFKVTTNGAWDNADFNLVGDAKFGGPNAQITVTEDNSTVVISFKESDQHANAYINGVLVDMGATEPTKPTETEPKPTETEPKPTEPACDHSKTTTTGKKTATYFEKGYTGDTVCADCGEVIVKGSPVAKKVLKTPKVTVKGVKKAIKVTYKNVKDAKGFKVTYKLGKKTFTKKYTLTKKELKKAKVTKTIK
ncbi:MAG: DUF4573 domain-containing protein, partial [Ruminococcus sp.]